MANVTRSSDIPDVQLIEKKIYRIELRIKGKKVGFVEIETLDGSHWELTKLGVDSQYRNNGYGKILVNAAIEHWSKVRSSSALTVVPVPQKCEKLTLTSYDYTETDQSKLMNFYSEWFAATDNPGQLQLNVPTL